jgi:two-component system cell cycle response regulator DivK
MPRASVGTGANDVNLTYPSRLGLEVARILLVEDNEMNRDMLSRRLQRHGHEVLLAVDGVEGVALARQQRPDLVLMDMSLPKLDGWEATRQIRADETIKGIPVIALTAHAMQGDREKAIDAGCDEYDTKPVNLKRLLTKIDKLLNGSGGGSE